MSETAKCENLLPEVIDYSVYQCGAVLRAKNKGVELEKSEDGGNVQDLCDRYDKMMNAVVSNCSESDVRLSISSSSKVEQRVLLEKGGSNLVNGRRDVEYGVVSDQNLVYPRIGEGLGNEDDAGCQGINEMAKMDVLWKSPSVEGKVVENVKGDRAKLLKKLDELKDQLSRYGNLVEKGKEKVPCGRQAALCDPCGYDNWHSDGPLEMSRVLLQQNRYPDHQNQQHLICREKIEGHGYYPLQYANPSHLDLSRCQMHQRGSYRAGAMEPYPPKFGQFLPSHGYRSGPFMDDSYPPKFSHHHSSCSCYDCHVKRQVVTPVFPSVYSDVVNDRLFSYQGDRRCPFAMQDYDRRLPLRSYNAPPSHVRWPCDVESDVYGFANRHLPRPHVVSGRKPCRPVAGGAPFLTCYICFELLLLPPKGVIGWDDKRKRMRCGACSIHNLEQETNCSRD